MTQFEFLALIEQTLTTNPAWINSAHRVVGDAFTNEVGRANLRSCDKDAAILAALSLLKGHVKEPLRSGLIERVSVAIHPTNRARIEDWFLETFND